MIAAAGALLIVSCNNDKDTTVPFTSELIGSYTPVIISDPDSNVKAGDMFVNTTWVEGTEPMIDMSFMDPESTEPMLLPASMMPVMMSGIYTGLYGGGLVSFDFKNDGTFGFTYHEAEDMMSLEFSTVVSTFPSPETEKLVPNGVLGYYTQDSKVYFKVSKAYLTQVGNAELGMDLTPMIDGIIETYKLQGSIVSTEEFFALPLKYTKKDGVLTIIVDRELILPFMPLVEMLVGSMVPVEIEADIFGMGTPLKVPARALLSSLLDGLITKSTSFEIGIRMQY